MTADELTQWLRALARDVKQTAPAFAGNIVRGCPIPFVESREWQEARTIAKWQARLINYFHHPAIPAHEWFETWSICLEILGCSYASGSAAHLDVSPRPTVAMFRNPAINHERFRAMVEYDVKWFFELLAKLPQVRLILVAGPIPKADGRRQQLGDFIMRSCAQHAASWVDTKPLPRIKSRQVSLSTPVFILPYEPKVDGCYSMIRQVY
jgi:hypothetical protein